MNLKRTIAPATDFITVEDAATQVFGDDTFDSSKLTRDIKAVIRYAETYTGRSFINQTWKMTIQDFPDSTRYNKGRSIFLPKGNLQSVTSLKYRDQNGTLQTLVEDTDYRVVNSCNDYGIIERIETAGDWPVVDSYFEDAVEVVYVVGDGDTLNATEYSELISGCMILIGELYATRQVNIPGNYTESFFYQMFFNHYKIFTDFNLLNQVKNKSFH